MNFKAPLSNDQPPFMTADGYQFRFDTPSPYCDQRETKKLCKGTWIADEVPVDGPLLLCKIQNGKHCIEIQAPSFYAGMESRTCEDGSCSPWMPAIPEPGPFVMLAIGLIGLTMVGRKRR